jgi:hypothetical protein
MPFKARAGWVGLLSGRFWAKPDGYIKEIRGAILPIRSKASTGDGD